MGCVPTHVLWAAEGDTGDALDAGQVQLLHGLAGLLLVARVNDGSRASGQARVTRLDFGVGAVIVLVLFNLDLLGFLVGKLFDSGVGHFRKLCLICTSAGKIVVAAGQPCLLL